MTGVKYYNMSQNRLVTFTFKTDRNLKIGREPD
jgi:hypothetical protein